MAHGIARCEYNWKYRRVTACYTLSVHTDALWVQPYGLRQRESGGEKGVVEKEIERESVSFNVYLFV